MLAVGHYRNINRHVFTDGSRININVNDLGVRCKGVESSCDPVVESGPDRDYQVTLLHGHVGTVCAVHAQHAHGQVVRSGKSAKPHKGHGHGDGQFDCKFSQFLICIGRNHSSAGIYYRLFGFVNRFARLFNLPWVGFIGRLVCPHLNRL